MVVTFSSKQLALLFFRETGTRCRCFNLLLAQGAGPAILPTGNWRPGLMPRTWHVPFPGLTGSQGKSLPLAEPCAVRPFHLCTLGAGHHPRARKLEARARKPSRSFPEASENFPEVSGNFSEASGSVEMHYFFIIK